MSKFIYHDEVAALGESQWADLLAFQRRKMAEAPQVRIVKRLSIRFKRLGRLARTPTKTFDTDAAWDIYAAESLTVRAQETVLIATELAIEIPIGWYGQLLTRSGAAKSNHSVRGGVIDSTYRGEVKVAYHNSTGETIQVHLGDRVAQMVFHEVPDVTWIEVPELSPSPRGENGFGSSGR